MQQTAPLKRHRDVLITDRDGPVPSAISAFSERPLLAINGHERAFRLRPVYPRKRICRQGSRLLAPRLDEYTDDRLLAERSACLQPLKAFHQHQALAVTPDQDRRSLTLFQHALGDRVHGHRIERPPPLGRHVYVFDPEGMIIHRLLAMTRRASVGPELLSIRSYRLRSARANGRLIAPRHRTARLVQRRAR